ncbi:hypothetical protein GMST_20340 [Geomonas silvestris]|uniref:histidine kinase n=1 Tax=Geomonas silvestris TaxID=2740184 RepID=A0A6V8MJ48_9BACT|nr:ATP-binding protein [Geomonas silvestris]GFO59709.1 hypothetical protein GMST_20340 [Geomonas silvestris]
MTPSIAQIKYRVRCGVGLILAAVLGISVWSIVSERANTLRAAEKLASGYVRALAEHSQSAFSEADSMLRVLQREIERSGGLERVDHDELLREMRDQVSQVPQIGSLFLVDSAGVLRLNSGSGPHQRISIADRDYFRTYLENPHLGLSISKPILSRLVHRWRFNLMRPLNPPGTPFAGLVALGFETRFFSSFFSQGTLGPRGRVVLIREDGVPLVYAPYREDGFKLDFTKSTLFREKLPNSPTGVYHVRNALTFKQPYIAAYQRLERYPVVALVTLHEGDVLAPWARKAATQMSLMLGLCLVLLVLTWFFFRHLDRLELALVTVSDQQRQLEIKAEQIDSASEAILLLDLEGRLTQFNHALCGMTGYPAHELLGRHLHEIEPPEYARRVAENLAQLKLHGQASFESAYLTKAGQVVPIEVNCRLMESQGRTLVLSIARDITQRKRDQLREQARRDLLEQIASGVALDQLLEGIVRFVEQELPGALCSVLLADERGERLCHGAAPSLPPEYNRAVDGIAIAQGIGSCGTAAFLRRRVVVTDIATHPYWKGFQPARNAELRSCWSEPVLSADGELFGTFAIYHREVRSPNDEEISLIVSAAHLASIAIGRVRGEERRRALEEQLRQAHKIEAVGQLAAGVAHDFNNLLTPIFVYADMIRSSLPETAPQVRQIEAVLKAAHKAADLTRKLLSFGRRQVMHMGPLDLNEVITSFGDIMRTTVKESISLELRLTAEGAWVQADRGQLEQVLLNFAVNAQDAIAGNGAITVETGHLVLDDEYARLHAGVKPGRYVLLAFSDNGCGMDEETLRHIYEPFFTTKEAGRGTGLGLATVYGIVKQHDGYIEVWSRPGQGTTFKIFLPLAEAAAGGAPLEERETAVRRALGSGKSILLVEDNALIRDMARDLLEGYGYRTLVAGTPLAALELATVPGERIDLLVSDVVMPEMNGPELYERILKHHPQLPVLYISGYTGNVVLHKSPLELETGFLTKPFTLEQFLERIRGLLGD